MSTAKFGILPFFVALVVAASPVQQTVTAQTTQQILDSIRNEFRSLEYESARTRLDSLIAEGSQLSPDALVEAHLLRGLINYSVDAPNSARSDYMAALSIDTLASLNPIDASPRAQEFFDEVRQSLQSLQPVGSADKVRYILVEDPRAGAGVRSLVIPGWGQLYKGEKKRGYVMAGSWALAAGATVTTHFIRSRKKSAYLDENNPALVEERFDTYSTWHQVRNNLALATAGIWVISYLDAVLRRAPGESLSRQQLSVLPVVSRESNGVSVLIQF